MNIKKGVLIFISFIFLISSPSIYSETQTEINVADSGPILLSPIPNQTWPSNQNNLNAFDLDDYFLEPNGQPMNYSYSNVENITIIINENNEVSFYPDANFTGTRTVIFTATDGTFNTQSNIVYLNVGTDQEAPKWYSPSRTPATVYQNTYVNFSTLWTDNVQLSHYIFSINQGSGWTNYSGNFSGVSNTSFYRLQISAASGTTVYWKFYAYDTSNNMNVTSTQSFIISSREEEEEEVTTISVGRLIERIIPSKPRTVEDFTIDVTGFKISLRQGSSTTRIMKITNTGTKTLSFTLKIEGLEKYVVLDSTSFDIEEGKSRDVTIDFSALKTATPGQYFGKIIVTGGATTKEVPIVLEIKALNLEFDILVNISENYKVVKPGKIIKANITILNIKDIEKTDADLYIAIKDFYGNVYDSSEEKISFVSSLSLERELKVPENTEEGVYIFYARVSDEKNIAIDSDTFEVGVRFKFLAFIKSSFIFLLILLLTLILAILMVRYKRNKEKERILSLYLMLNELKNLIKEEKFDEAIELYIRIKTMYHEKISREIIENKEKLKEEVKKLSEKLKTDLKKIPEEAKKEEKEKSKEKKEKEEGKEKSEEKKEEKQEKEKKEKKREEGGEDEKEKE